jgi:hypothetical protein
VLCGLGVRVSPHRALGAPSPRYTWWRPRYAQKNLIRACASSSPEISRGGHGILPSGAVIWESCRCTSHAPPHKVTERLLLQLTELPAATRRRRGVPGKGKGREPDPRPWCQDLLIKPKPPNPNPEPALAQLPPPPGLPPAPPPPHPPPLTQTTLALGGVGFPPCCLPDRVGDRHHHPPRVDPDIAYCIGLEWYLAVGARGTSLPVDPTVQWVVAVE